ncbi:NUDIX hydrolase [Macrococcus hajekii]|uniref:NUDIX hydrolase n=1 Tax=Macrococcus hajekii TaxID=198482 RepID=A0A4R6BMA1_9STAP|nr:NUDIX hydrolase [Macrococcus hajekii]TDM02954.1 NUDIX hydrolase [Macrococcus hajekii]GGB05239.1 ADP-ribose pyrophosphatase [Macrococcus hajekii]
MLFEEKTLSVEEIYNGRMLKLEKQTVELPDGRQTTREVVKHPGAVAVMAVKENKVLLLKQFRKAMDEVLIEVPAGKVEPGEDRIKTAGRELIEETGLEAGQLEHLYDFYVSPGFCDELISLYRADDLKESSQYEADADEFIELFWLPFDEIPRLLSSGEVRDAKTILSLQWLLLNYNNSK